MDKLIVTIDREYGSGGHEVARRLAARLGIKMYDEELIAKAAEETGFNARYIKENDERAPEIAFTNLFSGIDTFQASPFTKIQEEEFRIIREIAEKESCVIVGRAADYILQDERHVSIFIFAPYELRVQRKIALKKLNAEAAGVEPAPEDIDPAAMGKKVKLTDKQRRRYYEFYTDNKWGGREVYDLLINTSRSGIDGAVDIIEAYIRGGKDKDLMSDMQPKI